MSQAIYSVVRSSSLFFTFFAKFVYFLQIFLISSQAVIAVGVDAKQLSDPYLEQKARDLFKNYRCLVCQNQSIEDSDAELAADLRAIIRQQIQSGYSAQEIETFLIDRYGEWILLKPRFAGKTLILWLFPFALLIAGALLSFRFLFQGHLKKSKGQKVKGVKSGNEYQNQNEETVETNKYQLTGVQKHLISKFRQQKEEN